ncbi:hypothetical protein JAAARDRAFT_201011 [Jaapia argillacea MUCL 33604]|uniref:Uncharacterized protein n=1 Tax=Jaapia argillacea MUCL 33604 TaxID=933084 RepID=A0A067PE04_9AGAM|nr:hypothetical protein JAAARDRAFT_201011 [Jaapia argillacea MUCL 33604]
MRPQSVIPFFVALRKADFNEEAYVKEEGQEMIYRESTGIVDIEFLEYEAKKGGAGLRMIGRELGSAEPTQRIVARMRAGGVERKELVFWGVLHRVDGIPDCIGCGMGIPITFKDAAGYQDLEPDDYITSIWVEASFTPRLLGGDPNSLMIVYSGEGKPFSQEPRCAYHGGTNDLREEVVDGVRRWVVKMFAPVGETLRNLRERHGQTTVWVMGTNMGMWTVDVEIKARALKAV